MKALYLSSPVREALPAAIRPGGLQLTRRLMELVDVTGRTVVDAGCGTGVSLSLLREGGAGKLYGIDLQMGLLREAHERGIVTACASMEHLPLADNCCDLLLCECAWNLSNRQASLEEFRRVLTPEGWLVISDIFSRSGKTAQWPVSCCFANAAPLAVTRELVTDAGFSIEALEDHTILLKQTAAEFVFQYGSLEGFWERVTGNRESARAACSAGHATLPGLFLLLAKNNSTNFSEATHESI